MRKGSTKALVWAGGVFCIAWISLQFVRPELTNPPVTSEIQVPPEVRQILRHSCYNCHSNETKLSWYDTVVPAYWLAVSDIYAARHHVNFSEVGKLPADQQKSILFEAVSNIQLGAMPLPSYLAMHPHSVVTAEQLALLRAYLMAPGPSSSTAMTIDQSSTAKGDNILSPRLRSSPVRPAPNGIEFIPGYKNWKTISSTDRFDNKTVRVVLGNDVAMRAIAENQINPWPDGTVMAKVVWSKEIDDAGIARAGKFQHVSLMIRDSKKYAATKNWGFAWWNGEELQPNGRDASFSQQCVECHNPMRKNDYVFTTPIGRPR
jgi:hypothetical protein